MLYYKGTNEAEWILSIRQTLINQKMSAYVAELTAEGKVDDPKGNLNYLKGTGSGGIDRPGVFSGAGGREFFRGRTVPGGGRGVRQFSGL